MLSAYKEKILLVDDYEFFLEELKYYLEWCGYVVMIAHDIEQAYEILSIEDIAKVITAYKVYGHKTESMVKAINEIEPEIKIYSNSPSLRESTEMTEWGCDKALLTDYETITKEFKMI